MYCSDISLPDKAARLEILKINLEQVKLADNVDLDALSEKLEGYSGADISIVR